MRTYDDSFSGQKIYPGKVRFANQPSSARGRKRERELCGSNDDDFDITLRSHQRTQRLRTLPADFDYSRCAHDIQFWVKLIR